LLVCDNFTILITYSRTEEMLRLHRGQGYDIYWRDALVCPTEADYFEMVMDKTGGLFRLAVGLMRVFSSFQLYDMYTSCFPPDLLFL